MYRIRGTCDNKMDRHHAEMLALNVLFCNYCRQNIALGKKTIPAMAAGLTDSVWAIETLIAAAA